MAELAEAEPIVRLVVSDWRGFAARVWADPDRWAEDIWIPAPIAPHILAEWVIDRIEELTGLEVAVEGAPINLPELPYAQQTPDGRILA